MFTEERTVGDSGTLELRGGYAISAVPMGGGAAYPLELNIDNVAGQVLRIDDDGVLRFGPWNSLVARDLVAGQKWLIRIAETPDEDLGAAQLTPRLPVLLFSVEPTIPAGGGSVALPDDTVVTGPQEVPLIDVRAYRYVKLSCEGGGLASYSTQTLKLYLLARDNDAADTSGGETLEAGSANDLAHAGGDALYGAILTGEGLSDATTSLTSRKGTRFNYVAPYLVATGDFSGGTEGVTRVQLWGYP
jgi:hypothetical protein